MLDRRVLVTLLGCSASCLAMPACTDDDNPGQTATDEDSAGTEHGDGDGEPGDGDPGDGDGDGDGDGEPGDGDGDGDPGGDNPWPARFDQLFPQDHLVEIRLNFPEGGWAQLVSESFAKQYHPAAFSFDDHELEEVGVRFKGFSSLLFAGGGGSQQPVDFSDTSLKYPLKIDFNRFGGPRLFEIDRLILNNNVYDSTLMRERMAGRAYAAMGVHAPRTAYARVFIDDNLHGVYTLVQQVNKQFIKERYGTEGGADDGNLYKCIWSSEPYCDLAWRDDQSSDYPRGDQGLEAGLVLKTNEDDPALNDYSDLIALLDVVGNTPDSDFPEQIAEHFEVDAFLRLMAVTITLTSYDSYFGRLANFYLYHRPDTDRFEMIAWDMNMAYGLYPCQEPGLGETIFEPLCHPRHATGQTLAARILAVPEFRDQFLDYVRETVQEVLTSPDHDMWIDELRVMIEGELDVDPNYDASSFDPQTLQAFALGRADGLLAELEP